MKYFTVPVWNRILSITLYTVDQQIPVFKQTNVVKYDCEIINVILFDTERIRIRLLMYTLRALF